MERRTKADPDEYLYSERLTSRRTEVIFVSLSLLFALLLVWRASAGSSVAINALLFLLALIFLFYSLNYKTLRIRLTAETLRLNFGIFRWTIPLDNVESCSLDELPVLQRLGGAGIHFMNVRKRYRVSFNFLEHPRLVIALRRKAGPVRDVSFSTSRPAELLQCLQAALPDHENMRRDITASGGEPLP